MAQNIRLSQRLGGLRAQGADGGVIFDHVDYGHYWEQISEEVKAWSYMNIVQV